MPLVWRQVARLLAGERRFFEWTRHAAGLARHADRAVRERFARSADGAAGEAGMAGSTSGGSAGRALGGLVSGMFGWSASLLLMLGVLALAAPMVFGETWRSLFLRKPVMAEPEEADSAPLRTPARTVREPDNWETTAPGRDARRGAGHGRPCTAPQGH
ncbi:hypothetical protein ACU4GD_38880 [Cupriavidus basilensis]